MILFAPRARLASTRRGALVVATSPVLAQQPAPPETQTLQERTVRQFWEAFNRSALAELMELVTSDFRHHPPGKTLSLEWFKAGGRWVHSGLSTYQLSIDALVQDGNQAATRWTARGLHSCFLLRRDAVRARDPGPGHDVFHLHRRQDLGGL